MKGERQRKRGEDCGAGGGRGGGVEQRETREDEEKGKEGIWMVSRDKRRRDQWRDCIPQRSMKYE